MADGNKKNAVTKLTGDAPTNGGAHNIEFSKPYRASVAIRGDAPLLFHRYDVDSVEAKSAARKGSRAKKDDDLESYVYRDEAGHLCIPGEYLRMSCIETAKSYPDPRSPRRSAWALFRAGLISQSPLASLGTKQWDALDKRRVVVQRSAVPRIRPCMLEWAVEFNFLVQLPEYISPTMLQSVMVDAGRVTGVGDFRPTYGRFAITRFEVAPAI